MWWLIVLFLVGAAQPLEVELYYSKDACMLAANDLNDNLHSPANQTVGVVWTCVPDRSGVK